MISPTYELREIRKPTKKVQIEKDTLNLENVSTYKISEGLFQKTTLTVFLKSGETLVYEGIDKTVVHSMFSRK